MKSKTLLKVFGTLLAGVCLFLTGCDEPNNTKFYSVTFEANGADGTAPVVQKVESGTSISLPGKGNMNYSGKTFNGWSTNPSGSGRSYANYESIEITNDITFYAQWKTITYTITYNANGAGGSVPPVQTAETGGKVNLAGQGSMSFPGRTFSGWNTDASGWGTAYAALQQITVTANITLYAQWTITSTGSAPSTPTGVTAVAQSSTSIKISWNAVAGASYRVYYAEISSGPFIDLIGEIISVTSYIDDECSAGDTWYYQVSAVNNYGESAKSATVYATTPGGSTLPPAPTGVTAQAESSTSIKISWNTVSGASYRIYYSSSAQGPFTNTIGGTITGTSYIDTTCSPGQTRYYQVSAVTISGESAKSVTVSATTQSGSVPSAPTGVSATAQSSTSIKISWNAVSGASYRIYYSSTASGAFTYTIGGTITGTSYIDTDCDPGDTWYYKVSAVNSYGESAKSATVYATTPTSSGSLTWAKVGEMPIGMYGHRAVVKDGKIIVTVENMVLISANNGSSWELYDAFPDSIYLADHQYVLFNNKLWTVGGLLINGDYWESSRAITSTTDGINWTVAPSSSVTGLTGGISRHTAFAFNNAMWAIGGQTTSGMDDLLTTNTIWKSTNGTTWTQQTGSGLSARAGHASIVYNGNIYIAGGYMNGGEHEYRDVLRSSNGTTWTTITSSPGWVKRNDHTLVANSTGMYLIGGNGGDNGEFLKDVWHSTDGITWTQLSNGPFPERAAHASVIKDGYLYVIGGCNYDWLEPEYLSDVWRAYIGGTDLDFSTTVTVAYVPPKLVLTNNNTYPVKELYIYSSGESSFGNNRITANLAVNSSVNYTLDAGTYNVYVKDTQDRYKTFTVTISGSDVTQSITNASWTSPPVVVQKYSYTIKNNHSYAITGVYIKEKGTSSWGSNRISNIGSGGQTVLIGQFDAGLYDIKLVSTVQVTAGGGSSAGALRPAVTPRGGPVTANVTSYRYYEGDNLSANKTITVNSSGWTTQNK